MSQSDNTGELRVYMLVRADLNLSSDALASLAARTTWRTLSGARTTHAERFAAYDQRAQPKIGLRVKNENAMARVLAEVRAQGLPHAAMEIDGKLACVGVGPVAREELPRFVAGQQLMGDAEPPEAMPASCAPDDGLALWIMVRDDAGIPYGKLVAQAGHGVWGALAPVLANNPEDLAAWDAMGCPVRILHVPDLRGMQQAYGASRRLGLPSSFIVDAGRTVFAGRPTPTVSAVGPCRREDLPSEVASLIPGGHGPRRGR